MGRWATDVVALACIAGGAVVGAGVTAGLVASTDDGQREVRVRCVDGSDGARVVVRLGSGTATVSHRARHSGSAHDGCDVDTRIQIVEAVELSAKVRERAEAARARAAEARLHADALRIEADEMRVKMDELRLHMDEVRVAAEGVGPDAVEVRELAAAGALEAVERQLAEAEKRMAESGLEGEALTEALQALRLSLRKNLNAGGND